MKNETKAFTPGPWRAEGTMICAGQSTKFTPIADCDAGILAGHEIDIANAELIAQAPTMAARIAELEAVLKDTWDLIQRMPNYSSIIAPFTTGNALERQARAMIREERQCK